AKAEGRFGTVGGSGSLFRWPRLTANSKNPFRTKYLWRRDLLPDAVPDRKAATSLARILVRRICGPMARQKERRMRSLVSNLSPNVRRKATNCVTRFWTFIAGPPG